MESSRKLVAILAADVAGYTRLMQADESATVRMLEEYRNIFRHHITAHRGRVVDMAGDSVLAVFETATGAVYAAIDVQKLLAQRNATLPEERKMQFRIGVNLGEVIEKNDGTVYGDGVNIAARLESIGEPGGVCVSGSVYDQVEGKHQLSLEFAGEQSVKNFDKPVRAYHVVIDSSVPRVMSHARLMRKRKRLIMAAVMVAVAIVGSIAWEYSKFRFHDTAPDGYPFLAMPSGPAVAVLPFKNMSGDLKEEYFSDGLTEDIITELARFRELHVLARNATYQYKGQAVDIAAVGRKLGTDYVLEGSVRKLGDQVRITAQLIDARSTANVWADRYDRNVSDIFAVQDEIAAKIAATITGTGGVVQQAGRQTAARKRPDQLRAYDYVLQATMTNDRWSTIGYPRSKALLKKAIELDPDYARARQELAWGILIAWIFRFENTFLPPKEIKESAIKSVELDPGDALAHRTAAFGYFFDKQFDRFEREVDIALHLAPNDAEILAELGFLLTISGQYDRGSQLAVKAYTLSPASAGGWYNSAMYYDYLRKGQYREALETIRLAPPFVQVFLENQMKYVAVYGQLGELDNAREAWRKCLEIDPNFSVAKMIDMYRVWNAPKPLVRRMIEGYAKAGYFLSD